MSTLAASPEDTVEALEDIIYITDVEGRIVYVNAGPWRAFALANGGAAIETPESVLGRHLDDFLDGDSVREQFRTLFEQVRNGSRESITYPFRCDAPAAVRYMRLTMSGVRSAHGSVNFVIFQSTMLGEKERDAQAVLESSSRLADESSPLQVICAYCKRLQFPPDSGQWLEAEEYAAGGGPAAVRLSHGVCPDCGAVLLARVNVA